MFARLQKLLLATTALVPLGLAPAIANPLGAQVVGGNASVQGQGTANVTVTQSTDKAIINWNTFNIGANEKTQFIQPSSSAIALNRVTGGLGPSQIFGMLSANGRIFVVNPDGILIGPGAKIDTAGFLATTHDIANADFMAGRYNFSIPGRPDASVVNQGTITAQNGGFAALVAPGVRNSGTITARLGTIALASGNGFTLDFYGDKLITLGLNDSIAATVKDVATGQPLSSLVSNEGKLKANGGTVELTAVAARQVVDSVINNKGVIEANTIGTHNGMIVLGAATAASKPAGAPTQVVKLSGTISAAGKKTGTKGGTIQVTGENIQLASATIDASGSAGGGTVLIGGDVGGGNPNRAVASIPQAQLQPYAVPTASTTTVDTATTIDASAKDTGDGGKVVVWADGSTIFNGTILARGGAQSGNGGFVETSGHAVDFGGGRVDTSAPYGRIGQWLLDPATLVIDTSLANTVSSNLAVTNVTLSANTDLYLTANITKSSGPDATLTFIAPFIYHIEGVSVISTAGKLNIDYEASDRVWFGRGYFGGESTIISNGGNITLHGTHFVGVNGTVDAGYGQVLIRAENPVVGPDYGIWVFENTTVTGSSITLDTSVRYIDPSASLIIRPLPSTTTLPPYTLSFFSPQYTNNLIQPMITPMAGPPPPVINTTQITSPANTTTTPMGNPTGTVSLQSNFDATDASIMLQGSKYTFAPIGQLNKNNYAADAQAASFNANPQSPYAGKDSATACVATVYAMIVQAVETKLSGANAPRITIGQFLNADGDAIKPTDIGKGVSGTPITSATNIADALQKIEIGTKAPISGDITGLLSNGPIILTAQVPKAGSSEPELHAMLATGTTKINNNTYLVANDPLLGLQVAFKLSVGGIKNVEYVWGKTGWVLFSDTQAVKTLAVSADNIVATRFDNNYGVVGNFIPEQYQTVTISK